MVRIGARREVKKFLPNPPLRKELVDRRKKLATTREITKPGKMQQVETSMRDKKERGHTARANQFRGVKKVKASC